MTEDVRGYSLEICLPANSVENTHYANKMPVSPICWKDERGTRQRRLGVDTIHRRFSQNATLGTTFGLWKVDAVIASLVPRSSQAERFHSPETCQQHEADRREGSRMFTLSSDLADNAAKAAKFTFAQPPFPSANSELPGALRRIFSDDTEASGMTEQRPQGAKRSAGNARAAGGPTSPPFLPTARRLAGGNVRLHSLYLLQRKTTHKPGTEQGLDVSFDPASIALECRRLDRPAVSAKEAAGFSLIEIPIAHFRDGHADSESVAVGRRVGAFHDSNEFLAGEVACNLGSQHAVLTEHESPGPAFDVSVLNEEGLHARCLRADSEASQLCVPREYVSMRLGLERVY